jgi:hypothetical protein
MDVSALVDGNDVAGIVTGVDTFFLIFAVSQSSPRSSLSSRRIFVVVRLSRALLLSLVPQ